MVSTIQQLKNLPRIRHALVCFALCIIIATMVEADCPAKCTCTRYATTCSLARLNNLPSKLPTSTQLLRIELDNIIELNASVVTTAGLHNLTHLRLNTVNLQNIEPGCFQDMSKLEQLQLRKNNITILRSHTFTYLDSLHRLDLSDNNIIYLEEGAFSELPNLRYIDISNNYFRNIRRNPFRGMRQNNDCTLIHVPVFRDFMTKLKMNFKILAYMCRFTYFSIGYHSDLIFRRFGYHGVQVAIPNKNMVGFVFVNNNKKTSGVLYLVMKYSRIRNLPRDWFQNLTNLSLLDLSHNKIREIENGTFDHLESLRTLILSNNYLKFLKNGTFAGLNSITSLDISDCKVGTIESGAFVGLHNLQVLRLLGNPLHYLKRNTFSSSPKLKELDLPESFFTDINNTFQNLRYIKSVSNHILDIFISEGLTTFPEGFTIDTHNSRTHYSLMDNSYVNLIDVEAEQFINMDRLDSCSIAARVTLPENIQVLKYLNLYIDVTSVESSKDFRELLLKTRYIKELNLTLVNLDSTETLVNFSDIQVSTLQLIYSDIKILNNTKTIRGFPSLKSLIIHGYNVYSIQQGAFNDMSSLRELTLQYALNVNYEKYSFLGLYNLETLTLEMVEKIEYTENINVSLKCIDRQVFHGLNSLKELILDNNYITCINPGAFEGLHSIEIITMTQNYINTISPGVFGAECADNFEMSCKNVTLPEYCNSTKALKSLRDLDLSYNNLSYIHPYAFISCTKLYTLHLNYNKFLTLDEQFLFTPGLITLEMASCGITKIPNNTFFCTPLLSYISFSSNQNITKLSIDTVLPLKSLHNINMIDTNLLCDCELYKTWIWLRDHRVHYEILNLPSENMSFCGARDIDVVYSQSNCSTSTETSIKTNVTKSTRHDFAFFKNYIEPIILTIIFILGLTSNMFLLFVALRHSDMRTKQNIFIIHLAIVDVLSLTFHLPLSYWDVLNVRWEFDDTMCKIFIFSKDILTAAVVFSIICLGVERYLVARTFKTLKNTCISRIVPTTWLLFMTWLSAVVLSLPAYYSATVEIRCLYCPPNNQDYIRNVWTFQMIMYCLLPAAVLAFLNIKASMFLRESVKRIPGELKNNTRAQNRITVANIVLVLILIFIISYLPNYTLRVLVAWSVVEVENVFLGAFVTYCLFFCITLFNPISVFIMSSKFKSRALSYFSFREK